MRVQIARYKGAVLGENTCQGMPDDTLPCAVKNGRTNRDAVWVVDSDGPNESCVTWECTLAQPYEYD